MISESQIHDLHYGAKSMQRDDPDQPAQVKIWLETVHRVTGFIVETDNTDASAFNLLIKYGKEAELRDFRQRGFEGEN